MLLLLFANTATAPNANRGRIRTQTATGMVIKPIKVWVNGSWVIKPAKVWNGTKWVTTFMSDPPVLYSDPADPGFFLGRGLIADPNDLGFFNIYDNAVTQDPGDNPGFYTTGGS